jgi:hypothetical protein
MSFSILPMEQGYQLLQKTLGGKIENWLETRTVKQRQIDS